MHRHAYRGRKLSLERDQRRALLRGQVTALVLQETITTTTAKAKEVAPRFERLVTKAKKGDLASSRSLRQELLTENAVQKLIQELAPAWDKRQGGYTRVIGAGNRRGDNAPMSVVQLVLPPKPKQDEAVEAKTEAKAPAAKKTTAKPAAASAKPASRSRAKKSAAPKKEAAK